MRNISFYLLILLIAISNSILSQETSKKTWKSAQEINDGLHYHWTHLNADSAIYYSDELIKYQTTDSLIIIAYREKIATLLMFNKYNEGLILALSTYERYCKDGAGSNCASCEDIYGKLTELMVMMQDYRQAIRYLDKSCKKSANPIYANKKAEIYCLLNLPDSALMMTSDYISVIKDQSTPSELIAAYNNHGLIAKKMERIDEAINAFSSAISISDDAFSETSTLVYIIMGNLGMCYYIQEDYDKAYHYLLLDSEGSLKGKEIFSFLNTELILAEIDIIRGDSQLAKSRIDSLLVNYSRELRGSQKIILYELLMQVYRSNGNDSMFSYCSNKWIELNKIEFQDKIETHQMMVSEYAASSLRSVTQQIETEQQLMAQKVLVLEKEEETNSLRNWLLTTGLVLVIVVVLFFFGRYRIVQKKKSFVKETQLILSNRKQEIIAEELKNKKKDLSNVIANLSYKRTFIDEVQSRLKDLQEQPRERLTENITLLIREFNNYKNADKNIKALQADIDLVNLSFFNKLSEKFPLLTENEKELCGFLALRLSSKDIAIIRNIEPNTIKKARQKIRKKLPISSTQDLAVFLENI